MKFNLEELFDRLWPINRSLTGVGNRETLKILNEFIDINIQEIPSGTSCLDWFIPDEWSVKEAWIKDENGEVIVDFSDNNLHLMGYSEPVNSTFTYDEIAKKIYHLEKFPQWIPYKTSYYNRKWGFCMSFDKFQKLDKRKTYHAYIDSSFNKEGSMTYADTYIKGDSTKEIFFSTYICHPSMANNELSGPLVTLLIQRGLENRSNKRYSYRFFYGPETIGPIAYLSKHGESLKKNVAAGFVVTTAGDDGKYHYKKSKEENTLVNRATKIVLEQDNLPHQIEGFSPSGSDERQYCSPGYNLPVGSLMRTSYLKYDEYHTSADNKDFISFSAMEETASTYLKIVDLIENNYTLNSLSPYGEPQLGKRGLYTNINSDKNHHQFVLAMKWILSLSDGKTDLISMIERAEMHYSIMIKAAFTLIENKLVEITD